MAAAFVWMRVIRRPARSRSSVSSRLISTTGVGGSLRLVAGPGDEQSDFLWRRGAQLRRKPVAGGIRGDPGNVVGALHVHSRKDRALERVCAAATASRAAQISLS